MTSGERRLAERLQQKLDEDYLRWFDVPIGPKQSHPDFVVLHPRRGLLILETKDWRLDTIQKASRGATRSDGRMRAGAEPPQVAVQGHERLRSAGRPHQGDDPLFPVVAVVGARQAVAAGRQAGAADGDALEEMRLFYVGATRATSRLIVANAVPQ